MTTLSGGEKARVALARALATQAPVLLADEPTAALDPRHQLVVMELLRNAARNGNAILAIMHDLTLAARFADRVLVMNEGRIVAEGAASGGARTRAARVGVWHRGRDRRGRRQARANRWPRVVGLARCSTSSCAMPRCPTAARGLDIAIRGRARSRRSSARSPARPRASSTRRAASSSPPFVDIHFHMDATLSLGLPRLNQSGTLLEGIALWGELKPLLTPEAVAERALRYCDLAVSKACSRSAAMSTSATTGSSRSMRCST